MQMNRKAIAAAALTALVTANAQAMSRDPGPPDHRQVTPGEFDRLTVAGPFVVRVRTGEKISVSLSGPRTMLDDTELLVRDGQLIVRWQEGASWSRNGNMGVDVDISLPVIRGVTNFGAGSIDIEGVRADRFVATLASAGSVTIHSMDVGQLQAELAGAGSLRAAGQVGKASVMLASSGSFDSPNFTARNADLTSAGSGLIRATVTDTANIRSFGSGGIELTGGAKCTVNSGGSGHVHCS
jgi:hypothetical protein